MDGYDTEMKEMLRDIKNERQYVAITYEDIDRIGKFFEQQSSKKLVPISKAVGREISIIGADIQLIGGFTLYTETEQIYATFLDNCTIKLEKIFSDLPIGTAYHNKDSTGKYLYMFPEKLRMVIRLNGRVLKHYEFEVLNE